MIPVIPNTTNHGFLRAYFLPEITSFYFTFNLLIIHALTPMLVKLISVSKKDPRRHSAGQVRVPYINGTSTWSTTKDYSHLSYYIRWSAEYMITIAYRNDGIV